MNEKQIEIIHWQDIAHNLVFSLGFLHCVQKSLNSVKTKHKSIREFYITLVNLLYKK